jgi:hypothetical protein
MDNNERNQFLDDIKQIAEAVWDFHDLWGFTYEERNKGRKETDVLKERFAIVAEELTELKEAIISDNGQAIDEELGDLVWTAIGALLAVAHPDARSRVGMMLLMKNSSKNHENYAIREDTGKLISIHKPEKWEGAEDQWKKEWADRGLELTNDPLEGEDPQAPTLQEAMKTVLGDN